MTVEKFEESLSSERRLFVLFFASWCPFSRRFLPIYERRTRDCPVPCLSVAIDNRQDLCDRYQIEYYPTVLLFKEGKVAQRLDAAPGEGLSEQQLEQLLKAP